MAQAFRGMIRFPAKKGQLIERTFPIGYPIGLPGMAKVFEARKLATEVRPLAYVARTAECVLQVRVYLYL